MTTLKKAIHKAENAWDNAKFIVKNKLDLFDPVIIYPYRGYGNNSVAYLHGRILEKETVIHGDEEREESFWLNLHKVWKRFESDEIPGVMVEGNLAGIECQTVSDDEGYFTLKFEGLEKLNLQNGWHKVSLLVLEIPYDLEFEGQTEGEILICNEQASYGIISDVDDTIIESFANDTFKRLKALTTKDGTSRTPFEGVSELYQGLTQNYKNPLFFVSGSSYNLYDLLVTFCKHNDIPKAPFLLRDLGLNAKQWIKQGTMPYKLENIERILETYPTMSFILIGDSGQKDPEVYTKILEEYSGRVKAIYIRHVHTEKRKEELLELSQQISVPFLVMENSNDAIEHAKANGWIV
ncbi:MAG: hypothetical protein CMO01_27585 [Thalassobius sp.]|nr:hypothetical protein [Thalassovita sp.]